MTINVVALSEFLRECLRRYKDGVVLNISNHSEFFDGKYQRMSLNHDINRVI
jgi:hypothetical protein